MKLNGRRWSIHTTSHIHTHTTPHTHARHDFVLPRLGTLSPTNRRRGRRMLVSTYARRCSTVSIHTRGVFSLVCIRAFLLAVGIVARARCHRYPAAVIKFQTPGGRDRTLILSILCSRRRDLTLLRHATMPPPPLAADSDTPTFNAIKRYTVFSPSSPFTTTIARLAADKKKRLLPASFRFCSAHWRSHHASSRFALDRLVIRHR